MGFIGSPPYICDFRATPSCSNYPKEQKETQPDEWYICCPDGEIPLPGPTAFCPKDGTNWKGNDQCFPSANIALNSATISGGAHKLIDGSINTMMSITGVDEWKISLDRQYAVYAVVIILVVKLETMKYMQPGIEK